MTITNTTLASPTYNGNGSTTAFATGFQFISNSDLQVVVTDANGVETIKTITTHYTVTGAGVSGGGTVTFLTAPASGTFVNIKSNVTLDQQVDYVEGGAFSAATHEGALDKLTKAIQQVKEITDRSLTLPIANQDVETQTNAITAGYILRVNTAGDALEWSTAADISLSGLDYSDGNFLVGDGTEFVTESGATARTSLGLGTMATQAASSVSISGGAITGITDLAVADGGTGASTAAGARTNLGVVIGTDVQAYDADLTDLATRWTAASASGPASLQFAEDTDNGSHKVTLQAPSSLAADYTAILPTALPGSTQYLTIDNTGAMATAAGTGSTSPGGASTNVQFNNAGTFSGDSGFVYTGSGAAQLTASLIVGGNATAAGYVDLMEDTDNGSNYMRIQAPSAVTSSTTLTLPDGAGTNGYVLTTNGSGTLSWAAVSSPSAAAQSDQETATSTTTYVSPGRQQYHPSASKAWLYMTYSGGTPQLTASYNITSITDNGTGDATIVIATDFSSANYAVAAMGESSVAERSVWQVHQTTPRAVGSIRVISEAGGALGVDRSGNFIMFGDQ